MRNQGRKVGDCHYFGVWGNGRRGAPAGKGVADIARKGGIHFIGPNSMGHADTHSQLSTYGEFGKMPRGPVALCPRAAVPV